MTTYTERHNARRAAKKAYGDDATEGLDFEVYQTDDGKWAHRGRAGVSQSRIGSPAPEGPAETEPAQEPAQAEETASPDFDPTLLTDEQLEACMQERSRRRRGAPRKRTEGPTKRQLVEQLLLRPEGTTTREILDATGWPAVSVPQQAKASGLALRLEKNGKVTRYFGERA